jgi:TetR/AcrR family transcriptional repressor of mexJK operon
MTAKRSTSRKAEQVLKAARYLFLEHGFDATSMDGVADRAGVSKATVYAHYNDKETLFAAVVHHECQNSMVLSTIDGKMYENQSLEASLEMIGRAYLDTVTRPDINALTRMVVAEAGRFPDLGDIYYESGPALTRSSLILYLQQAQREGLLADCDLQCAANQFLSLLRDDNHIRLLLGYSLSEEKYQQTIDEAVTTFMARYAR